MSSNPRRYNPRRYCGHCHTCHARLLELPDGRDLCPRCGRERHYSSHGWRGVSGIGDSPCPEELCQDSQPQLKP
jgi:RNA polymerase subunit RPABC4/transcription elongation factor Spt4